MKLRVDDLIGSPSSFFQVTPWTLDSEALRERRPKEAQDDDFEYVLL